MIKPIQQKRKCKGQSIMEVALTIPFVLLVTLGGMQMFYEIFQIQVMNRAAEAAALAITYGTADSAKADAIKAAQDALKVIHLEGIVDPDKIDVKSQPATVEISAPLQLLMLKFESGKTLKAKSASFYIDRVTLDNSKTDNWFGGSIGFTQRPGEAATK